MSASGSLSKKLKQKEIAKAKALKAKIKKEKARLKAKLAKEKALAKAKAAKEKAALKAKIAQEKAAKKAAIAAEKARLKAEKAALKEQQRQEREAAIKLAKEMAANPLSAAAREYSLPEILKAIKNVDFFDTESDECLEKGCDNPVTTHGYCRLHYIKNWNEIKAKDKLLGEGKLQSMVEELVKNYPLRYLEEMLNDLKTEKSFINVLRELDIDSSEDDFEESTGEESSDEDIAFETRVGGLKGIYSEDD